MPEGPGVEQRRAAGFAFVAEAIGEDGRRARGLIEGTDIYGITAVIAGEGVRRLVVGGAEAGVLAPAQAFDVVDFLEFLAPFGVSWSAELEEVEARAA